MSAASLSSIIPIVAKQLALSPTDDRDEVISAINTIREQAFADLGLRLAYFRDTGCSEVQRFAGRCYTGCAGGYLGITLPSHVESVTHLDFADVQIRPARERMKGRCGCSTACLEFDPTIERSVFSKEIPPNYKGKIVLRVKNERDAGKVAGIEYSTRSGTLIREDVKLTTTGGETSQSPYHVSMLTLPERCGYIEAMTVEGYTLGFYHPAVTAASMLRLRVSGVRIGMNLAWEGRTSPTAVRFDTDVVEFGDTLQWKNFAMLYQLHFKTSKTPAEAQAYAAAGILSKALGDAMLEARATVPVVSMRPKATSALRSVNSMILGIRRRR